MTDAEKQLWGIDRLNVPRSDIPAVTHVDYSARVQTVAQDVSPRYWDILDAFRRRTGCSCPGQHVLQCARRAHRVHARGCLPCFMRTEMDALVLEDCILEKTEQPASADKTDWRAEYQLD